MLAKQNQKSREHSRALSPRQGVRNLGSQSAVRAIAESWISASDKKRFRRLPLHSQHQVIYRGERDGDRDTYRETNRETETD